MPDIKKRIISLLFINHYKIFPAINDKGKHTNPHAPDQWLWPMALKIIGIFGPGLDVKIL